MLCSGIALAASLVLAFKLLLGIGLCTSSTLLRWWCIGHLLRGTPGSVCTLVVDVFVFSPTMSWGWFVCLRHGPERRGVESRRDQVQPEEKTTLMSGAKTPISLDDPFSLITSQQNYPGSLIVFGRLGGPFFLEPVLSYSRDMIC
jgi:hypothetical protein